MNSSKASALACALNGFFTDYLPRQRAPSPHTLHSYRDSLKLLLQFVAGKNGDPSQLTIEALTVERVAAFLHHLEKGRGNQSSTRKWADNVLNTWHKPSGS
jgi:integrase/recombinase XerD